MVEERNRSGDDDLDLQPRSHMSRDRSIGWKSSRSKFAYEGFGYMLALRSEVGQEQTF